MSLKYKQPLESILKVNFMTFQSGLLILNLILKFPKQILLLLDICIEV